VKVEIDFDSKGMERRLREISMQLPGNVRKALNVTAMYAENYLLNRTEEGRGYRGIFAPYSASYAKFRKKNGYQTNIVDFHFSGQMTGNIKHRVTKNEAIIGFSNELHAKKAAMLNIKRPWFGFNNGEQKKIRKFFYRSLTSKAVIG
jgi:hypothetical protein